MTQNTSIKNSMRINCRKDPIRLLLTQSPDNSNWHHPSAMSPPFQAPATTLIQAFTLSALNPYKGPLTSLPAFCCFSTPIQLSLLCKIKWTQYSSVLAQTSSELTDTYVQDLPRHAAANFSSTAQVILFDSVHFCWVTTLSQSTSGRLWEFEVERSYSSSSNCFSQL